MAIQREGELIPSSVSLPENLLPRRNFLQVASLIGLSVILDACAPPSLARDLATATSTLDPNPTDKVPPTQPATATKPSKLLVPTPKEWRLSLAERVERLKDPRLFTELQGDNTRKIITTLYDPNEYVNMKTTKKQVFKNNHCGLADLTTSIKLSKFLDTGEVPDITIADAYNALDGVSFTDTRGYTTNILDWDDSMYFAAIPTALNFLSPNLFQEIKFLIPDYNFGARFTMIIPQERWAETLINAQTVCEEGGFVLIFCEKYGYGDILLATDVKQDGTLVIVDSRFGTAQRVLLKNYVDSIGDPEAKSLGEQPGLFNMIGVIPKLNASS